MADMKLPEMVIKADGKPDKKDEKSKRIADEVSRMGVLGTPGQIDMEAVKRMLDKIEAGGK